MRELDYCSDHGYAALYCSKCLQDAVKQARLAERRACLAISHEVGEASNEIWERINRRIETLDEEEA